MKKVFTRYTGLFLILFSVFGAWQAKAQVSAYTFAATSGSYSPISGGTVLNAPGATRTFDDNNYAALPIGFSFTYNGTAYTQFGVNANGWIMLGGGAVTSSNTSLSTGTSNNVIAAMNRDLSSGYGFLGTRTTGSANITAVANVTGASAGQMISTTVGGWTAGTHAISSISGGGPFTVTMPVNATSSLGTTVYSFNRAGSATENPSEIRYETIGSAPNRELVVQFTRVKRFGTTVANMNGDVFSFQIRLKETSNQVQIVYGTVATAATASNTFQVGLRGASSADFNNVSTTTNWAAPTNPGAANTATNSLTPTIGPASGQTYTWTPPSCSAPSVTAATSLTLTTATLNWNAASPAPSGGYQWEVRTSGAGGSGGAGLQASGSVGAGVLTANVTGLTASTTYSVYVRSDCGSSVFSGWSSAVTFYTGYCIPAPSSVDGTGITNVNFGASPNVNNTTGAEVGNYGNFSAQVGAGQQGTTLNVPITYSTGATYITRIWVDWNNDLTFAAGEEVYAGTSLAASPTTLAASFVIPLATPLGNYRMRIGGADIATPTPCYMGTWATFEDYTLQVTAAPACPSQPTALASSAVTSTTATISWTAASPAPASGYHYYVSTSATAPTAGTTPTGSTAAGVVTANLTGLTANTTYYYWVRSNCNGTDFSNWAGSGTFTTACANYTLNVTEGFNTSGTSTFPACWTQQYVAGSSNLTFETGSGNPAVSAFGGTGRYVRWNSYSIASGNQTRLVSPPITTTGTANVSVDFLWNHDNGYSGNTGEGVQVQYSTDGTTWVDAGSLILRYDASATSWNLKTVNLPAGAGNQSTVYVGFKFISQYGNNCSLDEALIYPTPACLPPTVTAATNVTYTSATLNWNASGSSPSDGYIYEVRTSGAGGSGPTGLVAAASGTVAAGVLLANVTGLSASTTYNVYVQADCNTNQSVWAGPITFITDYCTAGITNSDPTGITNVTFNTIGNTTLGDPGYVNTGVSTSVNRTVAYPLSVRVNTDGAWTVNTRAWIDWDQDLVFEAGEEYLLGSVYNNANGLTSLSPLSITVPVGAVLGATRMRVAAIENSNATPLACGTLLYGEFEDYIINVLDVPTCYPATALSVGSITSTGATATWTAPISGNTPGSYSWKVVASGAGSGGTAVASGTGTSPATISGLSANTSYDLWVQSNCISPDVSTWAGPQAFTTPCSNYTLTHTQDFNTASTTAFPTCWTQQYVVGSSNLTFETGSGNPAVSAFGGTGRYVRWNSYSITSGRETRLVSPPITTSGVLTSVSVDFRWFHDNGYSGNTGEGVQVQYSLDGTTWVDAGAFVTRYDASATGWNAKTIILPPAAIAPTIYVGFKFVSEFGNNCSLDQAVIYETPDCLPPPVTAATNVTQTTATINWTATTSATFNVGYEWEVRTSGLGGSGPSGLIASGTTGTAALSANVTGLSPLTTYQVYVRSLCTATPVNSTWGGPESFVTATTNPYCNATGIAIPDNGCYSLPIAVSGAPGNNLGTNSFLEEVRVTMAHTWDSDLDFSLISPAGVEIDLSSDNGSLGDNYGTVPVVCPVTSGYTSLKMGASSVTGGTAPFVGTYGPEGSYTAFNGEDPNGTWKLKVCDDSGGDLGTLRFVELVFVSCQSPTVATTTNISGTSATINWLAPTPAPGGYEYEVRLSGAAGSGATGLVASGSTTTAVTANIAGLSIGNTYTVYVRSNCGGSFSSWASGTFMTPPGNDICSLATLLPCGTVNLAGTTNLTVAETTPGTCSLSSYGVWYKFVGDGNITVISAASDGITLDLALSVLTGSCGSFTNIGCVDNGTLTEEFTFLTTAGTAYYVYLADYDAFDTFTGNFTISRTCYPALTNDPCASAIPVTCGSVTSGHNYTATNDVGGTCTVSGNASVWYSVVGTGYSMTAATCGSAGSFDSQIAVFSGTCGSLTCVGGNDDFCSPFSSYTFTSVYNQTYYIRVSGFLGETGTYNLSVNCVGQNVWTGNTSSAWATGTNWTSGTVPVATEAAIIPTNPTGGVFPIASTAASVDKLIINPAASVNVATGGSITVATHLDNNGAMYIANGASLVQPTGGTLLGNGTYRVERIGGSTYDYWSSPITVGSVGVSYLYNPLTGTYDTSDDIQDPGWQIAPSIMTPGRGYAGHGFGYRQFNGTVNNGTINYPVQFVNNPAGSSNPGVGWNLVGNPYPCGISTSAFITANSGILDVGAVYLWDDPGTVPYTSSGYATKSLGGATAGGGGNTPTNDMSSCQGFKVKVNNNGNIVFNNSMRVAANPTMLFREGEVKRLWLDVNSGMGGFNQTLVGFSEETTEAVDWGYDALKLDPVTALSLYSFIGSDPYAINFYDPLFPERIVPLGLACGYNTPVTFSLNSQENMENDDIILEDRYLGMFHDLKESNYVFQGEATQYLDRFFLHFGSSVTGIDNPTSNGLHAYVNGDLLYVSLRTELTGRVDVLDMEGRVVSVIDRMTIGPSGIQLPLGQLANGVYVVRITSDSATYSQKFLK